MPLFGHFLYTIQSETGSVSCKPQPHLLSGALCHANLSDQLYDHFGLVLDRLFSHRNDSDGKSLRKICALLGLGHTICSECLAYMATGLSCPNRTTSGAISTQILKFNSPGVSAAIALDYWHSEYVVSDKFRKKLSNGLADTCIWLVHLQHAGISLACHYQQLYTGHLCLPHTYYTTYSRCESGTTRDTRTATAASQTKLQRYSTTTQLSRSARSIARLVQRSD